MKSRFYYEGHHKFVATSIKQFVNSAKDFIPAKTTRNPEIVGFTLKFLLSNTFKGLLDKWCDEYHNAGKSEYPNMADLAFTDLEGFYSAIRLNSHKLGTDSDKVNLLSVERLMQFYESDTNVFAVMVINYEVNKTFLEVSDVVFVPIEFLNWKCLNINAFNSGNIQIANSENILLDIKKSRKQWMLQMFDTVMDIDSHNNFETKEKVQEFERGREYWENKEDIWT